MITLMVSWGRLIGLIGLVGVRNRWGLDRLVGDGNEGSLGGCMLLDWCGGGFPYVITVLKASSGVGEFLLCSPPSYPFAFISCRLYGELT